MKKLKLIIRKEMSGFKKQQQQQQRKKKRSKYLASL